MIQRISVSYIVYQSILYSVPLYTSKYGNPIFIVYQPNFLLYMLCAGALECVFELCWHTHHTIIFEYEIRN